MNANAAAPVLQFAGVHVSARFEGQEIALLRDIDFSVRKGQTLGLVGESGAGKSMVGRVVSGLLPENLRVSSGSVLFQGQALSAKTARDCLGKRIAFIPQEPLSALNPVLTVRQQMFEHVKRLGVPRAQREAYCCSRLREVGLPDPQQILGRYAHQLSGGQCQRILIAVAFSGEPELIVADEPTTALDVVTQGQIIHLLRETQKRHGVAVILITHDLRMAAHVCDEVAVLYAGDMVETGPAAQVLERPAHPYSRALKLAAPAMQGQPVELPVLPDLMPGLRELADLHGCRFAPRCATRNAQCEAYAGTMQRVGERHYVRCAASCLEPCPAAPVAQAAQNRPAIAQTALPADPPFLLELHNAGMQYRVKRPKGMHTRTHIFDALHPLSLGIRAGERVGVVGESGSGKSTLARIMAGLITPTSGEVRVQGVARSQASTAQLARMRETVQMIFQDPDSALNPRRTVAQLMTQAMEVPDRQQKAHTLNAPPSAVHRMQAASRLAAQVGMAQDTLLRFPSALSGGQKQRVNIARALCAEPRLLIADEIVSGLDVSVQALILNLLRELNRELGIALVFISHDLSVVRYLCQRVLVMYRGQVVEQGDAQTVLCNPQHPYTKVLLSSVPPDTQQADWPPALAELQAQMARVDQAIEETTEQTTAQAAAPALV